MFTYVLAKGINKGYLSTATYKNATVKAYTGLINQFVTGLGGSTASRVSAGLRA